MSFKTKHLEKIKHSHVWAFQVALAVKNLPANSGDTRDREWFNAWVGKILWRRKQQPTPVFLPGKYQGQKSLVGYSPRGHKESAENTHFAAPVAQSAKNLPAMQETWVRSLGQEVPLEMEMATHSSTLGWRIPWMEEPGGLQSMGSQGVRHEWATKPPHASGQMLWVFTATMKPKWETGKLFLKGPDSTYSGLEENTFCIATIPLCFYRGKEATDPTLTMAVSK